MKSFLIQVFLQVLVILGFKLIKEYVYIYKYLCINTCTYLTVYYITILYNIIHKYI